MTTEPDDDLWAAIADPSRRRVLDLIVHRGDMPILPGNAGDLPLLGFGLWRVPLASILLEAALSFLGAGVRPPNPSWGKMISEGVDRIVTAPYLAIVPGAMLVLTVLALNVFGDGVRDALDPRAKVKIDH